MNLFGLMETSGGAMLAERMRAEVVAANMANAETTQTANGGPYHRQEVVFAANTGDAGFLDSGFADSMSAASENETVHQNAPGSSFRSSMASFGALRTKNMLQGTLPQGNILSGGLGLNGVAQGGVAPGVHIAQVVEDPSAPLKRYDPGHPDAGPDGYVSYPDINPLSEMVDLMGATRAYGLNGSAVQAEKAMISSALEIAKG
jgi:flagellar basal-body rod protein FlgC